MIEFGFAYSAFCLPACVPSARARSRRGCGAGKRHARLCPEEFYSNRYAGDRETKLAILGRTTGDAFRFSLAVSIAAGLLGFLPAFFKWRWMALMVGAVFFVSGFLLSQHAVKIEFKRWQARVFGDVPTLISFAPSFLRVGGITLRDAISMTFPSCPDP